MENGYVLRVSQLNEYVNGMLRRETLLQHIGVRGEISGMKRHSSGHLYFSLKDDTALIRCVMFRNQAAKLSCALQDGMQVVAYGSISLFVRDGQFQLYVEDVRQEGEGELYRRFLMLKTRLEAQGLFDAAHKRALPLLPRRIGVVTSRSGAVIHDIVNVAGRRFPNMPILLYPAQVQGSGAAEDIAAGIRYMNEKHLADVLIVGRGGGSMEDLWAFNEEAVARAIYESNIPVVSAVGHETDVSIADYVADQRAPTPSAAAELCVPVYDELYGWTEDARARMQNGVRRALQRERDRLKSLQTSAGMIAPAHRIAKLRENVRYQTDTLKRAAQAQMVGNYAALDALTGRLEALSPRRALASGYALVKGGDGYISAVRQLHKEQSVELIMADGTAQALIMETRKES
ncbi:MAG: exodeoxyribonuclease VII large subunit [Clostridia bacterium]|nr:exodeoxyribonuclease VII large subunit [Clostridia bacterium]